MKQFVLAIVALFLTAAVTAQGDIISAKDFVKLAKTDKNLVIIDASKADSYSKVHVRNAVNIPHATLYQESEIEGLIKKPEELAAIFGEKGVSEKNNIVVYDDGSQKYSSRVYWILKYLGAPNVQILHKDMDEWRDARVPVTKMPTSAKNTTFTPSVNNAVIADIAYVKSGKAMLIDVRSADEFDGSADNSDGHLPGAINLDYKELLTDTEAFKSKDEMQKVLDNYGINQNTAVVAYCRTSVRATVLYAALVNVMGYNKVKVYDGAYTEWVGMGNDVTSASAVPVKKKSSGSGGGC
jgi:thiosulfate/3-mercaptopyruvate sulfurtransferase